MPNLLSANGEMGYRIVLPNANVEVPQLRTHGETMTADEKRERRRVKHDLQRAVLDNHFGSWKFYARPARYKAMAKVVADQILAGKNPKEVQKL